MPTIAYSEASHNTEESAKAWDREPNTRWTTKTPMKKGMYYAFELDVLSMISGIRATAADDTDNPASWQVKVRRLGCIPEAVVVAAGSGPIVATWGPIEGQKVWIECLSDSDEWWWSIAELTVDAEAVPPYVPPPVEPPPVVPPVVPPDPAVTDNSWRTWPEELCRQVVEGMADRFGWERKYREGFDFTIGKHVVREAIIYVGQQKNGEGYDPWPFENTPIGG